MRVNAPTVVYLGFAPASDEALGGIERDCELRAARIAAHAQVLERERIRLAVQRAQKEIAAKAAKKRRRKIVAEIVAWLAMSAVVGWVLVTKAVR